MRQFIVLAHEAPTTPSFSLADLAGGAGRLDLVCRCCNAALFRSHGIRSAVRIDIVLADELTIRFDGSELRGLHPDERSTAARIRSTLEDRDRAIGAIPATPSPGVSLFRRDTEATLRSAAENGSIVELHEDGEPLASASLPDDPVFVLSDHLDFTDAEVDLLAELSSVRVSLSPERLHADHSITVAHNYLDTDGFTRY
ncbi:tRNA (pseudouridine(54)-N(1))-methyltransferase TrmY [Halocatena halophila]|uniref:tRNA (pseudouridine(54)-N(1))-methyltransferase TrmY n=1 Tax=Halocatena halophila TaxID=2814576 RepID=UPI002ED2644D